MDGARWFVCTGDEKVNKWKGYPTYCLNKGGPRLSQILQKKTFVFRIKNLAVVWGWNNELDEPDYGDCFIIWLGLIVPGKKFHKKGNN